MKPGSRKNEVRRWLREQLGERDAVVLPDVVDAACDYFQQDENFVQALVKEELRPLIYGMAQQVMGKARHEPIIEMGDELVTRSEFEGRAATRFERWMEHCNGRHIKFMSMKRIDLIAARRENAKRAEPFLVRVDLIDRVLPHIKEEQTVRDVFSAEDMEKMYERIARERAQNDEEGSAA